MLQEILQQRAEAFFKANTALCLAVDESDAYEAQANAQVADLVNEENSWDDVRGDFDYFVGQFYD
jgi:hypothetical protein